MLRHVFTSMLLIFLVGCDKAEMLQKFTSPEDQAIAKGYIDLLRNNQLDEIELAFDPSIAGPGTREILANMSASIPAADPSSVTLVGAESTFTPSSSMTNLTYEYEFSGKWFLVNVAVKKQDGVSTIVGLNVHSREKSLEEENGFSLEGKSSIQYGVLLLAIVLPLFVLTTLVICIRTTLKGRKWPWVIFIVVGFGKLAVNWTTGQVFLAPLAMQAFSASAFSDPFGPWVLSVSMPVGAIIFLTLRKRLQVGVLEANHSLKADHPDGRRP